MPVKAIFFDIFGTLIDPSSDDEAHKLLSMWLSEMHGGAFTWQEHLSLYHEIVEGQKPGRTVTSSQAVWIALETIARKRKVEIKVTPEEARRLHSIAHARNAKPVSGHVKAVKKAAEYADHVGVISDADHDMAHTILESIGVLGMFDSVTTSEEVGATKPSPEIFKAALHKAGADPQLSVHIGDSWKDVAGAKGMGMIAVKVGHGRGEEEADAVADTLLEAVEKAVDALKSRVQG